MRPLKVSRFIMSVCVPISLFPITFFSQINLGYEVTLFPLYMLAIAGLSWEFGVKGAVLSVFFSSASWLSGNYIMDIDYINDWAPIYNVSVRTLVFILDAFFILMFRRVVEQHRRRIEAMRALLNVCHGCGSIQGVNGQWIPLEELSAAVHKRVSECPECAHADEERRGGGAG